MKKLLSLMLAFIITFVPMSVVADEFEFDIYNLPDATYIEESVLMELEDDVYKEFEIRLTAAWEAFSTDRVNIEDLKISKSDIVNVYSQVFFENPYYFYAKRSFSAKDEDSDGYYDYVKAKYVCADEKNGIPTDEEIDNFKATLLKIDKATEEILFYISHDMTDFEKIMTVHDYMVNNYVYDITDTDQTMLIVLDKVGVCAAYAEAFQHVMNVLGIECTIVKSDTMGHMWNMVKLDSRWYHLDITWDDPAPDQFAQVSHQYMLLSETAIKSLGYTEFDAPYYAGSTVYNNAQWRDETSALVTVGGIMYRVEGNNLIDENDNVIYENLDGGDGVWDTSETSGIKDEIFAGLCEINGVLYFNTDTTIYSYNPKTKETACVLEEYGIFGLYADKNTVF